MRILISSLISLLWLIIIASTAASDTRNREPTYENWRRLDFTICRPEPNDTQQLRPVIFPPVIGTFTTPYEDDYVPNSTTEYTEYIVVPARTHVGLKAPSYIKKRVIPSLDHPPTKRVVLAQPIAFLNPQHQLVDETGTLISKTHTIKNHPTIVDPAPQDIVIWEREKYDAPEPIIMPENPSPCSYLLIPAIYKTIEKQVEHVQSNTGTHQCKKSGGYELTPLPTLSRTVSIPQEVTPQQIYLWDHRGNFYTGTLSETITYFNRLSRAGTCDWNPAK